jgi:2-(1,2-epoxy-1,2-dihydrophenyl)acetyl-CoA isomerase
LRTKNSDFREGCVGIVEVERHERGIVRVVLNHTAARNALGEELRGRLLAVLGEVLDDAATRVVILATGLADFSVGGDLSRMDELTDPKNGRRRLKSAHRLVKLLLGTDKPLIAEVRGHAVGAGAGLALVCDTVVMAETARFGFPFARVGLVPDFALAYTLSHRMGPARARQALLYARSFDGKEALAAGIADDLVADGNLAGKALERARELAALPSQALALTKAMLAHAAADASQVLEFETMAQPICFSSEDFREGLAAFREKRKPIFDRSIA